MTNISLNDPLEIRHALERKLGNGAVTIFAKAHGYSVGYVSQTIAGARNNHDLLSALATCIGLPVRGVPPKKWYRASSANILSQ